ncbi:MAG: flagellar basal body protein, partial [Oscillospiraceae bacterium]
MRPTFFGFETAKRGLTINQKGIDITGHNLTNINTPGYTRQRIDQVSLSMS